MSSVKKQNTFFRLITSVGQRNNSEFPRGIEPQTFGFRAPMLYHWVTASLWWASHSLINSSNYPIDIWSFLLLFCLFVFVLFFARLFHPLVSCKETIWVATCKFGRCEYWQTNWWTIDWQVKEHAAHALGFLMVGDENFPHHEKLIDGLCEAAKVLLSSWIIMITETHNSQHRVYHKWEISSLLTLDR